MFNVSFGEVTQVKLVRSTLTKNFFDAGSKMACKFYILGITQGLDLGMLIADGKIRGGRPCIPENTSDSALELAVKIKLGQDLMIFPNDRKLNASGLVGAILVSVFPCRK